MLHKREAAMTFLVSHGNFMQVVNSTTMLYLNVVNITEPNATPTTSSHYSMPTLQVKISPKKEGVRGFWSWTSLNVVQFALASGQTNHGWFYACPDRDNLREDGLYVDFE